MSKTEVSGKQLKDGSVQRVDLDVATSGQSVIAKVVAGDNISISSTGADAGTGDVTINLGGTVVSDISGLDTRVTAVEADISALQGASAPNLSDLGEVSITSPSSGQVLKYNGLGWANAADSTFSGDYNDLSNKPTLVSALDDLSDVAISSPSNDQVLKYNGTAWVNSAAPAAGATNLDGLSDVAITSAAKGQFIVHDGTQFVNSNTIEASGAAVKPLIVKGAASQTANLLELQNSSGTALTSFDNAGSLTINASNIGAQYISCKNSSNGSGSFSILSVLNDTSGCHLFINSTGRTVDGGASTATLRNDAGDLRLQAMSPGTGIHIKATSGNVGIGTTSPGAQLQVTSGAAATKGLIVRGAASQTATLIEAQDSSGNAWFTVDPDGTLNIRNSAGSYLSMGLIGSDYSTLRIGRVNGAKGSGWNTWIGEQAGFRFQDNTGSGNNQNTGIGGLALRGSGVTTAMNGNANTALGYAAGWNVSGMFPNASFNTLIGASSANSLTSGSYNTVVGCGADCGATGTYQIALGVSAATTGSDAIAIGRSASAAANCLDIRFGNASRITGDSSGNIAIANTLHAKRYTETVANAFNTSLAPSSGTLTVDTSVGNAVLGALSASVTTWAFTNVPTENSKVTTVSTVIAGNTAYTYGSACSVNGTSVATGVQWFGGTAPSASSSTDVLTFVIIRDSAGTIRVLGSGQTIDSVVGSASAGIDGAGSANYLSKWTDANTIANSAIVESSGNVGIGTTSPRNVGSTWNGLTLNGSNSGFLDINANGTRTLTIFGSGNHSIFTNPTSTGIMYFRTQDLDRMIISSTGAITVPGAFTSSQPLRTKNPTSARSYAMGPFYNNDNWNLTYSADDFNTHSRLLEIAYTGHINTGTLAGSPYNLTTALAANLHVASDGLLYRSTSSLKYKKDVENMSHGLNEVLQLRPVTYKGKAEADGELVFGGLIAEEVHDAGLTEFVQYAPDGTPDALAYANMVSLAFKAIQELNAKVDALQAEKDALEARLAALENN